MSDFKSVCPVCGAGSDSTEDIGTTCRACGRGIIEATTEPDKEHEYCLKHLAASREELKDITGTLENLEGMLQGQDALTTVEYLKKQVSHAYSNICAGISYL